MPRTKRLVSAIGRPTRPLLRYHGGKWLLAPWIIRQFPRHRVYVEPFGGGASVLLRKPRSQVEIYNDLDDSLVGIFRVLQSATKADDLRRRCELTPFSRTCFEWTYEPPVDDIDAAHKTIFRSFAGWGSDTLTRMRSTGFKSHCTDKGSIRTVDWSRWPDQIPCLVERLKGVVLESMPAAALIPRFDSADTLFYVDPPYVASTRSSMDTRRGGTHGYRHEMSDEDHIELSKLLHGLEGMVVLSGYQCELYRELYPGWRIIHTAARSFLGAKRTELVWISPNTPETEPTLF